ncbi:hypothetical protein GW17_00044054 [Ensete ventricosum]|nr:hypothetical protein GW17_00044054 [Ensete ventricosum]
MPACGQTSKYCLVSRSPKSLDMVWYKLLARKPTSMQNKETKRYIGSRLVPLDDTELAPLGMLVDFDCRQSRPVCTGPTTDQYVDRLLPGGTAKIDHRQSKFDCRRSIKGEIGRWWSIEEEKGKRKKKRKRRKKKRRRRNTSPACP